MNSVHRISIYEHASVVCSVVVDVACFKSD
jgi:hypothetical protein